jgi:glycosyltransferase involved in cell wall biosynthesis
LTSVLVSHPHVAAFAVGLAESLAAEGKLSAFVTGVAFRDGSAGARAAALLARRWPVLRNRILPVASSPRLRGLAAAELGARLTARALAKSPRRVSLYDALFTTHDFFTSISRWPRETTAVYAYEDGALRTFQRAERSGLARIWDLPLPHYATIEETLVAEFHRWPGAALGPPHREPDWKQRRKDAELALATRVSVASAFTKKSLERFELAAPISVTPYGFPVESFAPKPAPPAGKLIVLSVGTHDLRKGTPYLLEAWKRAALPDAELHLVGPLRLSKSFVDGYAGTFRHWPHVPKSELGARYAAADVLAFPTLGDGFGLVIQEAMCSGTPVVTTPCGGGPECITDGVDGWIVPPRDADALVERLRYCAANRDRLFEMGRAARARAERWTWHDAGRALAASLEG